MIVRAPADVREPRARVRRRRGRARPLERARADRRRRRRDRGRGCRRAPGRRDEPRRPRLRAAGRSLREEVPVLEPDPARTRAGLVRGGDRPRPRGRAPGRRPGGAARSGARPRESRGQPRGGPLRGRHGHVGGADRADRGDAPSRPRRARPSRAHLDGGLTPLASGQRPARRRCRERGSRGPARRRGRGRRRRPLRRRARRPPARAVSGIAGTRGRQGRSSCRRPRRDALRLGADGDRVGGRRTDLCELPRGALPGARRARARRHAARRAVSIRLVDCRPRADYETGHVPGAVLLDPETTLSTPTANPSVGGRHPLPDPYALGAAFADAGIGPDTLVLAFDEGTGWAARCWWLLRHLGHEACGTVDMRAYTGPLVTEAPRVDRAPLRATRARRRHDRCRGDPRARSTTRRSFSSTRARRSAGAATRSRSTRSPGASPGHGTRSSSFPCPDDATEPPEVVAYCGSGVTACVVVAAARPRRARGRQALPRLVQRVVQEPVQPDRERRPVTTPYDNPSDPAKRQSAALTDGPDRAGARAMLKGTGFSDEDLAKPLVGVGTTWIETMPCNLNQRDLAVHVKRGVRDAGGTPMEFNTIAVSDGVSMGTSGMRASLVSREVIADSIELVARGHLFDGLVQLVACDKTNPGRRDGRRPARHPRRRLVHGLDRAGRLPAARGLDRGRLRGDRRPRRREAERRGAPRARVGARARGPARAEGSSRPTRCRRSSTSSASRRSARTASRPCTAPRRRPRTRSAGSRCSSSARTSRPARSSRRSRSRTRSRRSLRPAARPTPSCTSSRSPATSGSTSRSTTSSGSRPARRSSRT